MEINKLESKYTSREVKINDRISYEILYSSLEPEIQEKLENESITSAAMIPVENKVNFISKNARLNVLARVDIMIALYNIRKKYLTEKRSGFGIFSFI